MWNIVLRVLYWKNTTQNTLSVRKKFNKTLCNPDSTLIARGVRARSRAKRAAPDRYTARRCLALLPCSVTGGCGGFWSLLLAPDRSTNSSLLPQWTSRLWVHRASRRFLTSETRPAVITRAMTVLLATPVNVTGTQRSSTHARQEVNTGQARRAAGSLPANRLTVRGGQPMPPVLSWWSFTASAPAEMDTNIECFCDERSPTRSRLRHRAEPVSALPSDHHKREREVVPALRSTLHPKMQDQIQCFAEARG